MRTLVIGAGGVGGYLGARLAQAGADVTVAARGQHGRILRERGLELRATSGVENVTFARVVESAAALQERFDLVLITVKWPELEQTCDALPNLLVPSGVVAPLLNGLSSEEVVARFVGAQRTLAAVAYMSAGIVEPGVIYVQGQARLGLAPFRLGQEPDIERVVELLKAARVGVQVADDYRRMLWEKMVWNAPFNALCALTRRPSGAVAERMEPLVREAMQEVLAVAAADGTPLPPQLIDGMLRVTRTEFPATEPSMLQDIRRGRTTEVEILQGEVLARAERLGVAAPVMRTLATLIRALQEA